MPEIIPPSFDALTLAAVAAEVQTLVGARFAGVRQPAPDAIVVSLRMGTRVSHVFFSIHARTARVHVVSRPQATDRLDLFGLLLRSRLLEAHLTGVEQPPFNRVLRLRFDALEGPLDLVAELMGRHSNLVLADSRVVLGALKVVTAQMSPRRPVLPGRPYTPPPADRPRPDTLDADELRALLVGERPVWQQLTQGMLGLSPLVAREIALRAGLDPAAPAGAAAESAGAVEAAIREIAEIIRTAAFQPMVYERAGRIVAFAAIPLRVYADLPAAPAASMSEAVARYYGDAPALDPLEDRRRTLASAVRAVLRQRDAALEANRQALEASGSGERSRVLGELLLAYATHARPGETAVSVPDHTAGGVEITIPLDPQLSVAENAQRLFRRYQKARATARALPARIAQVTAEIGGLRDALVQIETAGSSDDLWEVHADLAARGSLRRAPRSRPASPSGPRRYRTEDGATIVVGRSARENDHVTFRIAGPDDLWFHARGIHGAHVVLKAAGTPSEAAITAAARAAAYYSEGRQTGQVAVDCVLRKHVRKMRGAPPGAVVYEGERTLRVSPAVPDAVAPERAPRAPGAPRALS